MDVKISACTITKNEEKNIARSIESYKKYVDEIIIVDTGSTDNTVEIAKSLGAKVINFKWINDFAAAKNCAINSATGDWILFLDADEWIKDDGGKKIQSVVQRAIAEGFDAISPRMLNLEDDGSVTEITSSLRFFINKPSIRYIRKIHEYLFDSEKQRPLISMKTDDILLNHSGYATSISKMKIDRNKELLEKNYLSGNAEGIDYFYLARENLLLNPQRARQFLDILMNDKKKMEEMKKLDIANNIHDLKLKLSKVLINEYTFEERIKIVDEAIKDFPLDPTYYYYKYVILKEKNEKRLELLEKALELDKDYEKKVVGNNNTFSRYKSDVLCELGLEALLVNDTMKAMEYFVQSAQIGEKNAEVLRGLLYIINSQELNEKISFLNSIYDISKEETLEFLVQTLRLTQYNEVFLYYFVKYYKDFGKVDISLFTSMMLNKKYEDAANKYLTILLNENDIRAEILIVSAIIAGNLKEFYDINKVHLSPAYKRILNGYFYDINIEEMTNLEQEIISSVVSEIIYIAPKEVLEKLKKEFNNSENILRIIVNSYFADRNYKLVVEEINTFIENDLSDEFAGEITAILGKCFYKLNDYDNARLYFSQAVEIGYLDAEVCTLYKKILENTKNEQEIEKILKYETVLNKFIEANSFIDNKIIEDIVLDEITDSIKEFENEISETISLTDTFKRIMYDYACKLVDLEAVCLAETYFKILLKASYNEGICYYNLGEIYNKLGLINLSYVCYKKAFETALDFPSSILPEGHKNKLYLYNKVKETNIEICPICGDIGKLKSCYQFIENENLRDNNIIAKYRECEKCNHIFVENCNIQPIYAADIEDKDAYIFNAYDIMDKVSEENELLILSENEILSKIFEKSFNVEYLNGSIEKCFDLNSIFNEVKKYENKTLVTIISDIESTFNESDKRPLWANPGIVNAYSKQSVKLLFNKHGIKNVMIFDSKFLKGKMIVIAKI